ncbi:hypothetical protein FHR72_001881 [Mycolicibacterium iranicum]|uniref:Uncharacterized protein n=1 Tax=Mycolicibacterium iranicum TaxID=912594 RepID=A0A839Q4L1_MYCIR|nr:hypothetical protein [Mycolicibacterium iranicum]MBB2990413.1 hypothetical protein [Mycolicibacterium iranicum]
MGFTVVLEHRTGYTTGLGEKQARQSTDVGAPGILDVRRVRTVLQ